MRAEFKNADTDGSGTLDFMEISAMFPPPPETRGHGHRRASHLHEQAWMFLEIVDTDRSGSIDKAEWREFILTGWRENPPAAPA